MKVIESVIADPDAGTHWSIDMRPKLAKNRWDEGRDVHLRAEHSRTGKLVHGEVGLSHLERVAMRPHDSGVRELLEQGVDVDGVGGHLQRPDARRARLKYLQRHAFVCVCARHVDVEEPLPVCRRGHDHVPDQRFEFLVGTNVHSVGPSASSQCGTGSCLVQCCSSSS